MVIHRFDIYLVRPGPTIGSEIRKVRPAVVVSPDEMNQHIRTVIIAPTTRKGRPYPTRVPCRLKGRAGQVVLDQIRAVDSSRLLRKVGRLSGETAGAVLSVLAEMFAP